jgi:LuxR family maltose regulon positive regulatory protein
MAAPILTTKLHIPSPRRNLVPRPRLLERLDAGLNHRLTLVSAPAGFGKTTLLAEWVRSLAAPGFPPVRIAWLSLDAGDNDPARFSAYLTEVLHRADGRLSQEGSDTLGMAGPFLQESQLVKLINQVAATPQPVVVILDDYHLIAAQPIHDAVAFLIDHVPENLHLVLATRADPPLALPRLRVRGHLVELRQSDLRFTVDEAAAFLNRAMGLDLAAGDVAALEARTEGWIAGLQMAALSLQGQRQGPARQSRSDFIRSFTGSHRYVLDYLVEEVLDRQPPPIREFLLRTSILARLSGSLCDAVMANASPLEQAAPSNGLAPEIADSQAILEHLEAANLFIVSLDDERGWYRYHRLFSDLLRRRLGQSSPELLPELHRRASLWHEEQGLMAEAIDHALAAEAYERAARLIEGAAEATLMRSELATLLRWVEGLPDESVRTRPLLCVYHAWALLFSGHSLEAVESRLALVEGERDSLAGKVAPLRALIAVYRGDMSRVAEWSRQALEQLGEEHLFLRGFARWLLGVSRLVSGDWVTGHQALEDVVRMSQEAGNVMLAVMVMCNQAELSMKQGQLHKAQAIYRQALDFAVDVRRDRLPIAGEALLGLGELSREWNDLLAAERYLTQGIELIGSWAESGAMDGYISLAHVRQAQGDAEGARAAIQMAQQLAARFEATELDDVLVAAHRAHLWIIDGNLEPAVRWFEEEGLTAEVALSELESRVEGISLFRRRRRTRQYTALARLLIAQRQPGKALLLLAPLQAIAERWMLNGYLIAIQILKAMAYQARGDGGQAKHALDHALCLAEPEGYMRIFLDEGKPVALLLSDFRSWMGGQSPATADHRDRVLAYADKLLAAFAEEGVPAASPIQRRKSETQVLIEPLTERELEVLGLLATGMSNPEIADLLCIAVSTVRSHCKSIYGKLDVHRRWDAVERGRELGLI